MSVSAVVLAGGKALRMGGEKPLRKLRGKTLIGHAIDLVAPLCGEVVVSVGARQITLPADIRAVPDRPGLEGRGPLSGILAGLEAATGEICLLLPCDLPNMKAALLRGLLDELGESNCVYCEFADGQEPLVAAVRRTAAAKAARAALEAGRFMVVPCWADIDARVLNEAWAARFGDSAGMFANVNTPQDLKRLNG